MAISRDGEGFVRLGRILGVVIVAAGAVAAATIATCMISFVFGMTIAPALIKTALAASVATAVLLSVAALIWESSR